MIQPFSQSDLICVPTLIRAFPRAAVPSPHFPTPTLKTRFSTCSSKDCFTPIRKQSREEGGESPLTDHVNQLSDQASEKRAGGLSKALFGQQKSAFQFKKQRKRISKLAKKLKKSWRASQSKKILVFKKCQVVNKSDGEFYQVSKSLEKIVTNWSVKRLSL